MRLRRGLIWLVSAALWLGCDDTDPAPPPPPAPGPLALTGWAADFAGDPEQMMGVLREASAWLELGRGRARAALHGFRAMGTQSDATRIGQWRAAGMVAAELDMLADGMRAVADAIATREKNAGRRAAWRSYLLGDPGAHAALDRRFGAALLIGRIPLELRAEVLPTCQADQAPALERLLACALAGEPLRALEAADRFDWVAFAERGRHDREALPVDPAPVVALAGVYADLGEQARCRPVDGAQVCISREPGGPHATALRLFAPPARSSALATDPPDPIAFAGRLRARRERHQAWVDGLDPGVGRVLQRFRAVDGALCADLLGEAEAHLAGGHATEVLAMLALFPRSTCGALHGKRRVASGRRAALHYTAAVAVGDAQAAYSTADARAAAFDPDDVIARGPWHLAASACRWWRFTREFRPAPSLPSE